jgi:hypothetical protein
VTPVFSIRSEHLKAKHGGWHTPNTPFSPQFQSGNPSVATQTERKAPPSYRLLASNRKTGLCAHHLAKKPRRKLATKTPISSSRSWGAKTVSRTPKPSNNFLNHLYNLLARDRISARRASTLACISSLLLRTLPVIDRGPSLGVNERDPDNSAD